MQTIDTTLFKSIKKPLLIGTVIGVAVVSALLFYSDYQEVASRIKTIDMRLAPLIVILAPLNYLLRYIKWNYYLKISGIYPDPKVNRFIFLSGLSMTITPGKVGELWKCYLLKEHLGTPVSKTAPIVVAERVSDGLAILALTCIGLFIYSYGLIIVGVSALILASLVLFFKNEQLFFFFTKTFSRFKSLDAAISTGEDFYRSLNKLLLARHLLVAVGLGIISWSFEGLIVFLAVKALGGEITILASLFVIGLSSLAGAVSFLPGGLGVAEASIMAILLSTGLGIDMAATVTLITRFSTLWIGVTIGIFSLFGAHHLIYKANSKEQAKEFNSTGPGRNNY